MLVFIVACGVSYLSRPLDVSCSLRHDFSNLKLQRLCEDIKYCCDLLTGPKRIDYSSCGFDILGEGGKGGGLGRMLGRGCANLQGHAIIRVYLAVM